VPPQDLHADRWNVPIHGMPSTICPTMAADAQLHLARRLVGEGDAEDFRRPRPPGRQDVGDAGGQHAGLAGPGASQHQHRPSSVSTAARCSGLRSAR